MSNEQDLPYLPKPGAEPPGRSGISRIKFLRRIISSAPAHYAAALGSYGQAPEMFGEDFIGASKHLGDTGYTEEVNIPLPDPLPEWLMSNRGPIKRDNTLVLVRPEREEAILIEPEPGSSASVVVEEILSQPQSVFNPPYKQEWRIVEGGVEPQHDTYLQNNPFLKAPANLQKAA